MKKSTDLKHSTTTNTTTNNNNKDSTAGAQGEGGPTPLSLLKVYLDYGMEGPFQFTVTWEFTMEGIGGEFSWNFLHFFFFFVKRNFV